MSDVVKIYNQEKIEILLERIAIALEHIRYNISDKPIVRDERC